jgi:uncharacterized repeat protein (TIGR02543 family)
MGFGSYIVFMPNWPGGVAGTGNPPPTIEDDMYEGYFFFDTRGSTLAKASYTLLGWSSNPNATTPEIPANFYDNGSFWGGNCTTYYLYAIWQAASSNFTVSYNGNGNTGGVAPTDGNSPYLYNSTVAVIGPGSLIKADNVFLGWSMNSGATAAQYTQGSTFVITGNITLYAVWAPPRTVTYNANGALSGAAPVDPNSPYQHGSTVTVLGQGSLSNTGWYFGGWDTDPESIMPLYGVGSTFTIVGNVVLYAIWFYGGPPVGNLFSVDYNGNGHTSGYPPTDWTYPPGATITVLGQGTLARLNYNFLGWATTSNATTPNRIPGSTFGMPPNSITLYAVWSYTGSGGGGSGNIINVPSTINVAADDRYTGSSGSKGTVLNYTGSGNETILKIASNLPNNKDNSAIIENLIIDGKNQPNTTGILLEDVYHGLIRNVTIMNCEIGIKVKLTGNKGTSAHGNRFEHIRMINVKTGILFEGANSAKDFSYTVIDDVGIGLEDQEATSDVGVKLGSNANLYCAFIKANVWLAKSKGTGLEVNGKLCFSKVNFAVEQDSNYNGGYGVRIKSGATVYNNQSFLLTALSLPQPNRKLNSNIPPADDVTVAP